MKTYWASSQQITKVGKLSDKISGIYADQTFYHSSVFYVSE